MSTLKVHLTYGCSSACSHCRFHCRRETGEAIDPELVMETARVLKARNHLSLVVLMGGEPGLVPGVTHALCAGLSAMGLQLRVETNASWAVSDAAAAAFLRPLAAAGASVSYSVDAWHAPFIPLDRVIRAIRAYRSLGGQCSLESAYLKYPECGHEKDRETKALLRRIDEAFPEKVQGYEGTMLFNGRAARDLAPIVSRGRGIPRETCTAVPWWSDSGIEGLNLLEMDPSGFLSKGCGIAIGNVKDDGVQKVLDGHDPRRHPIFSVLLGEGPLGLARMAEKMGYVIREDYADRCHLCQEAREVLRPAFPRELTPIQHYPARDGSPMQPGARA
jgi:hypothetical protein